MLKIFKNAKKAKNFEKLSQKVLTFFVVYDRIYKLSSWGGNWSLKIEQQWNFWMSTEKCEGISLKNFEKLKQSKKEAKIK